MLTDSVNMEHMKNAIVTYATRELSYNFDGSPSAKKLAFKLKCITEAKQFFTESY